MIAQVASQQTTVYDQHFLTSESGQSNWGQPPVTGMSSTRMEIGCQVISFILQARRLQHSALGRLILCSNLN